ncbi:MAG: hypothetical protein H6Q19_2012, partial [Bacteroidetes bacterium]|nr:hypothetical protein [Bacteroidota bacterium]
MSARDNSETCVNGSVLCTFIFCENYFYK